MLLHMWGAWKVEDFRLRPVLCRERIVVRNQARARGDREEQGSSVDFQVDDTSDDV